MLTTDRLVLRRFRAADQPTLAAYRGDPDVARYQSWSLPVPADQALRLAAGSPDEPGWFQ